MSVTSNLNNITENFLSRVESTGIKNIFLYLIYVSIIAGLILGCYEFIERHYATGYVLDLPSKLYGVLYSSVWLAAYNIIIGIIIAIIVSICLIGMLFLKSKVGNKEKYYLIWIVPVILLAIIYTFFFDYFYFSGADSDFTKYFLFNKTLSTLYLYKFITFIIFLIASVIALYFDIVKNKSFIKYFLTILLAGCAIVISILYLSGTFKLYADTIKNIYIFLLSIYNLNYLAGLAITFVLDLILVTVLVYISVLIIPRLWKYTLFKIIIGAGLFSGAIIVYLFTMNLLIGQSFYVYSMRQVHYHLCIIILFYFYLLTIYIFSLSNITPGLFKRIKPKYSITYLVMLIIILATASVCLYPKSNNLKAFINKSGIIQRHLTYKWLFPVINKKRQEFYSYKADDYCTSNPITDNPIIFKEKPDVFIITFDALRTDFATSKKLTPNLHKFLNDSYFFENNYSHATHTPASLSAINISKYFATPISSTKNAIARIFFDNGYDTSLFIGTNFHKKKIVFLSTYINDIKHLSPVAAGFETISMSKIKEDSSDAKLLKIYKKFIQEKLKQHKPIFSWFHIYNVHDTPIAYIYKSILSSIPFKNEYTRRLKAADKVFGDYISFLKKENLYDNSIIILFSDHGEEIKEHSSFYHSFTLYDELIKVPLAIKLSNQKSGKTIKKPVSSLDILPTLINILGSDPDNRGFCGESLLPLIENSNSNHKLPISSFYQSYYIYGPRGKKLPGSILVNSEKEKYNIRKLFKYSIVDKNNEWKVIYNLYPEYIELYNLKEDPHEKNNLIDKHPQTAQKLLDIFEKQIK